MPRLQIDPSEIRLPDYGARARLDGGNDARLRATIAELSTELAKSKATHISTLAELGSQKRRYRYLNQRYEDIKARYEATMLSSDVTPARLIALDIAEKHDVTVNDIMGVSRVRPIVYARHEAFYEVMKRRGDMSVTSIGAAFGCDHTTVLWGTASHIERNNLPPIPRCNFDLEAKRARMQRDVERVKAYRAAKRSAR